MFEAHLIMVHRFTCAGCSFAWFQSPARRRISSIADFSCATESAEDDDSSSKAWATDGANVITWWPPGAWLPLLVTLLWSEGDDGGAPRSSTMSANALSLTLAEDLRGARFWTTTVCCESSVSEYSEHRRGKTLTDPQSLSWIQVMAARKSDKRAVPRRTIQSPATCSHL